MAQHLIFERYCWFDGQIRRGGFPNASTLACRFEISTKTAKRNIEFMRLMLGAPLQYDSRRRGYCYSETGFSLPPLEISQNELLAVLLAQNLLSDSAGGVISRSIRSFGRKLFATTSVFGLSERRINEGFSASWHGHAPAEGETFRTVADALIKKRQLSFRYFAPSKNEHTNRLVEPHHLLHYMGGWVLLARCLDRDDWRKFHLGRMSEPRIEESEFTPLPRHCWQPYLEGAFGIFQGGAPERVTLRFTPFRARWIRDELWHIGQTTTEEEDGSLLLSFTVTDHREVKLRILQYGADVEVVEPQELREKIQDEIRRMANRYGVLG